MKLGGLLSGSRRNIIVNAAWALITKGANIALGLLTAIVLTRYLGKDGFGLFSGLTAFVAIALPITDAGLNAIITRNLLEDEDSEGRILGTANRIRMMASAIVITVMWFIALLGMKWTGDQLVYISILLAGIALRPLAVVTFWFEAKRTNKHATWADIAGSIVRTALIVLFAAMGKPILWLIVAHALSPIVTNLVALYFYRKMTTHREKWSFDKKLALVLIGQSWFLILSSVANVINLKIDQVFLLSMRGEAETGVYSAAVRISEVWYTVPLMLMSALFPSIFAARQQSEAKFEKRLQQLYDVFALVAMGLALLVTLSSGFLIGSLFGPQYAASAAVLTIHTWAAVFVFMRVIFSRWLIMEHMYWYSLVSHGGGAVMNIAMNLYFIPRYGAMGAAYSTLISYGTSGYLTLFLTKKTRQQAFMMTKAIFAPVRYPFKLIRRLTK